MEFLSNKISSLGSSKRPTALQLTHVGTIAKLQLANINHCNNAAFHRCLFLKWAASMETPINQWSLFTFERTETRDHRS